MLAIIITLLWFAGIVAIVNWLQIVWHYRYGSHWYLHLPIVFIGIFGLFWLSPAAFAFYGNSIGVSIGSAAIIFFLIDEQFRSHNYKPSKYFTAASVRPGYGNLFRPPFMSSVVKVTEVFFQNVTLLLLILSSAQLITTWWQAGLFLSGLSFLVHAPAIKTFNWWYGGMFTTLSTIFIFFTPFLVFHLGYGIHLVYAIHLLMYPMMMHLSYAIGKGKQL